MEPDEELAVPDPENIPPQPPPQQQLPEENNMEHIQLQQYRERIAAIAEAEESFLTTIANLNRQNRRLEGKINEADAQNNLLQMQIKVLNKKMENLELFMTTLNDLSKDNDNDYRDKEHAFNCPNCGYNLEKGPVLRKSESLDREMFKELLPSPFEERQLRLFEDNDDDSNPLMVDLVLANVMSHLQPSTLLNCRLVNRLWNSEASYHLQKCHTFKLNSNNIGHISKYTKNPETSSCLFSRLKVELGFVVNEFRNDLEEFFQLYGSNITHFSISCEEEFANRLYTEEFRNIFLGFISNVEELEISLPTKITERNSLYDDVRPKNRFSFPKLKSITFNQFNNSGGYNVWFAKEMIKMGPNLQSIRVETHNKEVVTRIILALGDREVRTICGQLKHLYLDAFVTQQHLDMLSQLDFPLKSLQLSSFTVEVTSEKVEAFLSKHRWTLETLILGDYHKRTSEQSTPLVIRFPIMSSLMTFKLVDPIYPDQRNLIFNPLSYAVQLPKLRKISFEHENRPSGRHWFTDLFNGSTTPCITLRELRVSHNLVEIPLIGQAAKMFPHLERLDVSNVTDAVLKEIWTHFDFIVDLRVELCPGNVNVDSLFTGIPYEICNKIHDKTLYTKVEALDVLDVIRTEPSICNLSKLRTLKIDGLPSNLLTAVSGYLAISQLKTLTSISIKSEVASISKECRRVLGEKLNLSLFELF